MPTDAPWRAERPGAQTLVLREVLLMDTSRPPSWRAVYADAATVLGRGLLAGLVGGALVGGVGGRLAMFLLRLTSSDAVRGLQTDDDFRIGAVTPATLFLIVFAALLGAVGGLIYLGVREWLPPRVRPLLAGLLSATGGGALIIHPGGVDFTVLEPQWLAVALFVLLPGAYGVALSRLTEWLIRSTAARRRWWLWAAFLPLGFVLLASGPVGLGILLVLVLGIGGNRSGHVARLWRSPPVTWLGRGVVAAALGISAILLVRDIAAVL